MAERVLEVTKGEPLLARFISQDVTSGGERVLAALEQAPPSGVNDYFQEQLKQLDARAEGDTAWEALGVLLVAHGAMMLEELATILELPVRQIRRAITPIQRFLVGRDRVELMHLELRAVVAEEFSRTERQAYRRRLLAWCARYAAQGWPDDTPDYVLGSYASHLREARDNDGLYRLIDRRWMELKAARTHSYQPFARDVLLALEAANSEDPPNLVQGVRGSLIYATLTSLATNMPPKLLAVLARLGQLPRAEGYAALIGDSERRMTAYSQIAAVLIEQRQLRDARLAADQALTIAQAIPEDWHKARALAEVAQALVDAGQPDRAATVTDQALTAAQAIPDDWGKAQALAEVAKALANAGHTDQALGIAQAISNNWLKAEALIGVARALVEAGQPDWAVTVIAQSLALYGAKDRSWFFMWLRQVASAPFAKGNGMLRSLCTEILDIERWWTR